MPVKTVDENGAIGKDFVQIFLVRKRLRTEHRVIPATAEDPVIAGMPRGIFAQAFLNLGGILCAFEIHSAEVKRAFDKMDVAVDETREHQFSTRVNYSCSSAAHAFDCRVVTDSHDLAVVNSHGLGPGLPGILGVNAAAN